MLLSGQSKQPPAQQPKSAERYREEPEGAMCMDNTNRQEISPLLSESERLKDVQKSLGYTSQQAFAEALGIKQGSLSDIYRAKNGIKVSAKIKIALSKMGVNIDWLDTGEGPMLLSDQPTPPPTRQPKSAEAYLEALEAGSKADGDTLPDVGRRTDVWVGKDDRIYWTEAVQVGDEEELRQAREAGVQLIPEYSEAFRGGSAGETEELRTVETYWGIPQVSGNMIVPVRGDSMAPKYPAGCRVVLKPYPFNAESPLTLPFGEVYAVAVRQADSRRCTLSKNYIATPTRLRSACCTWPSPSTPTSRTSRCQWLIYAFFPRSSPR